jgi:hypothetical protein
MENINIFVSIININMSAENAAELRYVAMEEENVFVKNVMEVHCVATGK